MTRSVIQIRVSEEQKAALNQSAREAGVSLTELILKRCLGLPPSQDEFLPPIMPMPDGMVVFEREEIIGKTPEQIIQQCVKKAEERLASGESTVVKPKRDPSGSCARCTRTGASERHRAECPRCIEIRTGKKPKDSE